MNKTIKTVKIKGKDYVEVNQRVKYFIENFKDHCIETEIIKFDEKLCVIKAVVKNSKGKIISMGHAFEKAGSSFINETSYLENCETSAIGRALGFLGIGIDASIASYEEVANASMNQTKQEPHQPKKGSIDKKEAVPKKSASDPKKQKMNDGQAEIFRLAREKGLTR